VQDAIAMSSRLGRGMAIVNPMATKQKEAMRYPRIESLRNAMDILEPILPASFIPEGGIDFVYALPNPQDFHEICGLEGREIGPKGTCHRGRNVTFGSGGWISRAIMMVNIERPELLSGIELRHSGRNEEALIERGIAKTVTRFEGSEDVLLTMVDGPDLALEQLGLLSGSLFKSEGMGRGPRIGILGKDPNEILRIIGPDL
jgi:predicted fused transcriptional regulator/phosphomethylpyrimidine kinase